MIFTVHVPEDSKPASTACVDAAVFVPEANAKWALIFGPLWLAFHRLWWALAFYVPIAAICLTFIAYGYNVASSLLAGLPGLFLLFEGNEMRRRDLEWKDYALVDVVEAPDATTAEEVFFARHFGAKSPPNARPTVARSSGSSKNSEDDDLAFGLFPEGNT